MIQNSYRRPSRPVSSRAAALAILFMCSFGAAAALAQATSAGQPAPEAAGPAATEKVGDAMDKVGGAAERVVERPLKDFNIIKPKVQPALEAVMDDPYSLDGLKTCGQYRAEIAKLTAALGPDVDSPQAVDPNHKDTRAEFALGAGEAVASSFIPGGGLIRKISGAEKRQKYAAAAVYAGSVRRAYLKGLMHGRNCRP